MPFRTMLPVAACVWSVILLVVVFAAYVAGANRKELHQRIASLLAPRIPRGYHKHIKPPLRRPPR